MTRFSRVWAVPERPSSFCGVGDPQVSVHRLHLLLLLVVRHADAASLSRNALSAD